MRFYEWAAIIPGLHGDMWQYLGAIYYLYDSTIGASRLREKFFEWLTII